MAGFEGLLSGRLLADRYRIEEVIGRGGMGAVYRGKDERLGRAIAVKVITAAAPDAAARERMRARFRHEAASAARLPHHPNVVPVYDYGTDTALGMDFLVMELLRGEDLAATLARIGPPPPDVALDILQQAARGVAVGHRAGLVHRDVKPGNIFLVQTDETEPLQVRVLDFGIAKAITTEEDTAGQLTQDGRAPLSPAYASPEQLRGEQRLTPASDVFSLGAVGFQILTGTKPFTDTDRNRMGIGQAVPAPSPRARNPVVSPALEAVILRCLADDPTVRFADAAALADALDRARRSPSDAGPLPPPASDATQFADDDRTLFAPPPRPVVEPEPKTESSRRRHRKEEPQRRSPLVWILPVLLLLAAGGIFAVSQMDSGGPGPQETLLPPDTTSDTTQIVPTEPVIEEPQDDAAGAFTSNQEGLRVLQAGQYDSALAYFRRASTIAPDNPEYRNNFALTLLRMERFKEAAFELEYLTTRVDPNRAVAYLDLAAARLALGDTAAAVAALQRVLTLDAAVSQRQSAEQQLARIRAFQQQPALPPPVSVPAEPVPTPLDTVAPDTSGAELR